jgi:hypothetical protein
MKKKYILIAILAGVLIGSGGCATRDAAMLGHLIGKQIGTPFGVAAVAIEESVATTHDIVKANPRYDGIEKNRTYTDGRSSYHVRPLETRSY